MFLDEAFNQPSQDTASEMVGIQSSAEVPVQEQPHEKTRNAEQITNEERSATALAEQEAVIADGRGSFESSGKALTVIRDQELYKLKGYSSFLDYTKQEWDMHRRYADHLIRAAEVMAILRNENFCSLPTCEAQVRPLTPVSEASCIEVWRRVVKSTVTGKITAAIVRQVVRDYQQEGKPVPPKIGLTKDQEKILNALIVLSKCRIGQIRELVCSYQGVLLSLPQCIQKISETLSFIEITQEITQDFESDNEQLN